LGLEPIRGELAVFDTPERLIPTPIYTRDRGYIAPKDGYTLVGSTVEHVGFEMAPSEETRRRLRERGIALVPALKDKVCRTTTIVGLRPGTPDELPFIGPLPDHANVIVAAGHYRNGVLLAPITAKLVADLVAKRTPRVSLEPFSPTRCAVRV
jgi:glycine oxidase